jgi:hypothetical protein
MEWMIVGLPVNGLHAHQGKRFSHGYFEAAGPDFTKPSTLCPQRDTAFRNAQRADLSKL